MKEKDIERGKSYLFKSTDVEHRKFMIGTIVTVSGVKKGKKCVWYQGGIIPISGRKPKKFKLTNGHYANAANLQEL